MRRKAFLILVATVIIFFLAIQLGFSRKKDTDALDTTIIIRKLDEVLVNQAEILKQFEEIKQELAIIKIRASR